MFVFFMRAHTCTLPPRLIADKAKAMQGKREGRGDEGREEGRKEGMATLGRANGRSGDVMLIAHSHL